MIQSHTIPGDVFAQLAAGAGGERAGRLLADAERSKKMLLLRDVVVIAGQIGHERAWELAEAYDLLAGIHEDHPEAVERLLRHPSVGTWAFRMRRVLPHKSGGGPVAFTYLPGLAVAAAVMASATVSLDLTVPGGRVVLPTLGVARLASAPHRGLARVTVRTTAEGGEVSGAGTAAVIPRDPARHAEGWTGIRRLSAEFGDRELNVLLDDVDPYRIPEGWPALRQKPLAVHQWREALQSAWALLAEHHPWYADEIAACITTFVPLRRPGGRTVSSTSRHAFGAFAASLPPDGRILASLLAHEVQHDKLWALLDLVSLTERDAEEEEQPLWYAAWRDDPRPLVALLQGAYAHLAVAAFWRVQRFLDTGQAAMRAHAEYARWRQHTSDTIETLRNSAKLTPAGEDFVAGMAATIERWRGDAIPDAAADQARTASAVHMRAWRQRNEK